MERIHRLNYDLDKMLFTIPAKMHGEHDIRRILEEHPEVKFVSFVGIDMGGHDTDEKIPTKVFLDDLTKLLVHGVQTDGSSVALPGIADLNNAKIDIIPDLDVNWYVDHNFRHIDYYTGLPVGTLRIPSFLVHNEDFECGSRVVLRDALKYFRQRMLEELKENNYVYPYMDGVSCAEDIEELLLTSATELEFWVRTPDDKGDREQLFTSQVLKEQYWKRTYGQVRTALEEVMTILDCYGFEMEMGHKEVGGVQANLANEGHYNHIMEQLEIDWKYADAMQAADNENHIKYVVRDIFTMHGLDVTFMAKPVRGVAGSGEHTHLGLGARLKNGKIVSLFAPEKWDEEFLSPIGFGALMGLLRNYELINPFVSNNNDAFNRLKPGYEAPVCTVTSLGRSVKEPSRNRTVLAGLIRDVHNPAGTRFELRSPNPKSNTYLVLASSYLSMLDGIEAALSANKTPKELEKSISKKYGDDDFYLERDREYRSEKNVFTDYSEQERQQLFGKAPATVWENLMSFENNKDRLEIFYKGSVMSPLVINSYVEQTLSHWKTELHDRIIPATMNFVRECKKVHDDREFTDMDIKLWLSIDKMRHEIAKDELNEFCLLTQVKNALDTGDYALASDLQLKLQSKVNALSEIYSVYVHNVL